MMKSNIKKPGHHPRGVHPKHKTRFHLSFATLVVILLVLVVITVFLESQRTKKPVSETLGGEPTFCEKRYEYPLLPEGTCEGHRGQVLAQASNACGISQDYCKVVFGKDNGMCFISVNCYA